MRLLVVVFTLIQACYSAVALGQSEAAGGYTGNTLGTMHFYTPEGAFQPTLEIEPTLMDTYSDKDAGSRYSSRAFPLDFRVALQYGIVDRVTAGLQVGDLVSRPSTAHYTANGKATSSSSSNADGLLDPLVRVGWRAYQDPTASLFADVNLSLAPSTGTNDEATSTQKGNGLNGYSEAVLGATLTAVRAAHEFGISFSVTSDSPGKVHSDYAPNSYNRDTMTKTGLTPRYRWHFSQSAFVQPDVNVTFPYVTKLHYANQQPPSTNSTKTPTHTIPGLTLGYLPRPDALLSLAWHYNDHDGTTSSTNPANSGSWSSVDSYLTLGLTGIL